MLIMLIKQNDNLPKLIKYDLTYKKLTML